MAHCSFVVDNFDGKLVKAIIELPLWASVSSMDGFQISL